MACSLLGQFSRIGRNKLTTIVPKNVLNLRAHSKLEVPVHKVNNLEKKFLVWTGKYKSVDEIPAYVPQHTMERARNRMRIRISNGMMVAAAVGCVVMAYIGKKAAERGETITKQNLEWHRHFNEQVSSS